MGNLERFIEVGDSSGAGTIWTCCVTCLAHLAALCHLIGRMEPTLRDSMGHLCDLALDKLGNVSHEAHIEEYSHFDVLTGVRILVVLLRLSKALTNVFNQISWKRALDTIDERIGLRSRAESEPLRRWRGVIEKAYSDLQASLRGYGLSLLGSLSLSVDGRAGGSTLSVDGRTGGSTFPTWNYPRNGKLTDSDVSRRHAASEPPMCQKLLQKVPKQPPWFSYEEAELG